MLVIYLHRADYHVTTNSLSQNSLQISRGKFIVVYQWKGCDDIYMKVFYFLPLIITLVTGCTKITTSSPEAPEPASESTQKTLAESEMKNQFINSPAIFDSIGADGVNQAVDDAVSSTAVQTMSETSIAALEVIC